MPIRVALIFGGLFIACLGATLAAWLGGSELYLFCPGRRYGRPVDAPPTDLGAVLSLLAVCAAVFWFSPRNGLIIFTALLFSAILGCFVGPWVFGWGLTWAQVAMVAAMSAAAVYGWAIERHYLDD